MDDKNIIWNLTTKLDLNEDPDWFYLQDGDLYRALVMKLKSYGRNPRGQKTQGILTHSQSLP